MCKFKKGDKVLALDSTKEVAQGGVYTVKRVVFPFCNMFPYLELEEVYNSEGGYNAKLFELVKATPLKPPSFKSFLSPMCRVELGNGSKWIYVDGEFITKGDWQGSEHQYGDDGKLIGMWASCLSQGYEIVKVFDKPKSPSQYLNIDAVGALLWESPKIVAARKVKEQKVAEIQKEIKEWEAKRESSLLQANSATSVISDLEKQLKGIE